MASLLQGLAFPLRFGPLGHFERSHGTQKLKDNIKTIALTEVRERLFRDDFGTLGYQLVLRNVDEQSATLLRSLIYDGVASHEPRVLLTDVSTDLDSDNGRIRVVIQFSVVATGKYHDTSFFISLVGGE